MQSENAINLENAIIATLTRQGVPTEEEVQTLAASLRMIPNFAVSDDEFAQVLRRIHTRLQIDMDTGAAVVEEYQPWLPARKPEIEPYYWERFDAYLKREGWPPRVIARLDQVTDDILNLLGDPLTPGAWERRGLVMGDVQSGKTATYTALTCKASDAGYRLIILLTGTLENLRRQTQERLDMGFVGLDSSGWLARERRTSEVGVGEINRNRMAVVFTSRTRDFNTNLVNQLNLRIREMAEPILLVVKKHKRILENLENWLRAYNAGQRGHIDTPMLLLDDEADNASVNTNSEAQNPTAINERIRSLLGLFTRKNYVGFTATPFANIFIDPDTADEMHGNDLFPRDFIYDTKPEMRVRAIIHGMGYRYRLHRKDLPGRPDLVFPSRKKVIFVHGCFFHLHDCRYGRVVPRTNAEFWAKKRRSNVERDMRNIAELKALGWQVCTIWECETKTPELLPQRLGTFLGPAKTRHACSAQA